MTLVLTVLRCPDNAVPETRQVSGGEFIIGRSADAHWRLADPLRAVSKHHCMLCFLGGEWRLRDLSTNGTFVNRDSEPVGRMQERVVQDGDRLHIGSYEIELRIESAAVAWRPAGSAAGGEAAFGGGDALLPDDFDVLDDFAAGPAQSDHAAAIEESFVPPTPARTLLPDEGIDWLAPVAPGSAPADPVPQAEPPPARRPAPVADTADIELLAAFLRGAGLGAARLENPVATMERLGAAFRAAVAGLRAVMIARASVKGEFRIEQTMIRASGNNPLKFSADDDDALSALLGTGRRIACSRRRASPTRCATCGCTSWPPWPPCRRRYARCSRHSIRPCAPGGGTGRVGAGAGAEQGAGLGRLRGAACAVMQASGR